LKKLRYLITVHDHSKNIISLRGAINSAKSSVKNVRKLKLQRDSVKLVIRTF